MGTMASQITSLTIVYSTVYSGADQRRHQSSALLAFVRGIHRWPVNSLHKWPVTRKMFPFDTKLMNSCHRSHSHLIHISSAHSQKFLQYYYTVVRENIYWPRNMVVIGSGNGLATDCHHAITVFATAMWYILTTNLNSSRVFEKSYFIIEQKSTKIYDLWKRIPKCIDEMYW